jgi:16S rRNA (cytosine967-C5)-methyltransferase
MPDDNSRFSALRILDLYHPQKTSLSKITNQYWGAKGGRKANIGFVRELVWGTVRFLNTIDFFIDRQIKKNSELEPRIRNILRLGIFQLLFLKDRVPAYAAVNETVGLTRLARSPKTTKLVNAVLRKIERENIDISAFKFSSDRVKDISLRHSHPEWLVEKWLERFGEDEAIALMRANNTETFLTIRVNTLKTTREGLIKALKDEGVDCAPSAYSPTGVNLLCRPELEAIESFRQGCFMVQDEASQKVTDFLDPQPGDTVIDLCAGSGTKTSHIAQVALNKATIHAVDTSAARLRTAKENFKSWGIENVEFLQTDARTLNGLRADRILADVPCSGLGIIRKKPDIKWNRSAEQITGHYPGLQKEILSNAASLLKPGGTLVYSTCTTEPEENEKVIEGFMASAREFEIEQAAPGEKYLRLSPERQGTDGFFAAKLRKK